MTVPRESNAASKGRDGATAAKTQLSAKTRNYRFKYIGQKFNFLDSNLARSTLSDEHRGVTRHDKLFRRGFPPTSNAVVKEVTKVDNYTIGQRLVQRHQVTVESMLRQLTIEENRMYNRRFDQEAEALNEDIAEEEKQRIHRTSASRGGGSAGVTFSDSYATSPQPTPPLKAAAAAAWTLDGDFQDPYADDPDDCGYAPYEGEEADRRLVEAEMASLPLSAAGSRGISSLGNSSRGNSRGINTGGNNSRGNSRGINTGGNNSRGSSRSSSREKYPFVKCDPRVEPASEPPAPGSLRAARPYKGAVVPARGKIASLLLTGEGDDILNNMSVIEEGASVLEGSVLMEEWTRHGHAGHASPINLGVSVDGTAFSILQEDGSSAMLDAFASFPGADSYSDVMEEGERLENSDVDFNEERGITTEADSDMYEESLKDELVNFHADDLLGDGDADIDGESMVMPDTEARRGALGGGEGLVHCGEGKKGADATYALHTHSRRPERQKQERVPDADLVDMSGFPFFVPVPVPVHMQVLNSATSGEPTTTSGKPTTTSGEHTTHHAHEQQQQQQQQQQQHRQHQEQKEHSIESPKIPHLPFHVKYAKREVGEHAAAPMPYHNDHKHDLHDFHEPGLVHTYARHSMSHNLVKDGFDCDIHRAHQKYKQRQEEAMTKAIAEAKEEAERKARRAAIDKAYKEANHKRRGATLLGNLSDEDESSDDGEESEAEGSAVDDLLGSTSEDENDAASRKNQKAHMLPLTGSPPGSPNTLASYLRPEHAKLNKEELRDLAIAMRNLHIFYRNYGKNISAAGDVTGILEYRSESPREVLVTPNTPYGISMLPVDCALATGHHGGENIGPMLVHVGPPPAKKGLGSEQGQGQLQGTGRSRQGRARKSLLKQAETQAQALTLDFQGLEVQLLQPAIEENEQTRRQTRRQALSAREYVRPGVEKVKTQVPAHRVAVPVTARTDEELGVGSWRIRMPMLNTNTAAKGDGTAVAFRHSDNAGVVALTSSPIKKLIAPRLEKCNSWGDSPVLQIDHYGNRFRTYHEAPLSPPAVLVPAVAPHPPEGCISSSNHTLKFSAGNRRVLRKVAAIEVESKEAANRDLAMRGRSAEPHIAKIPLQSHVAAQYAAREAQETHAKLLKLPIAEAFKSYSVENNSRAPLCL